jgi:hypothetical protein
MIDPGLLHCDGKRRGTTADPSTALRCAQDDNSHDEQKG